ncbi:MAG: rod shape-determining protein MreC [Rikenellaceae bacterium]
MHRIIEFLRSVYVVVLFVILECVAINFYAHSDVYTQAKMLGYSNRVVGGAQGVWGGVREYFGLRGRNDILVERVAELENELSLYRHMASDSTLWAGTNPLVDVPYRYIVSKVVSNTINKLDNYIVLNRGSRDGVNKNMAVISPGGAMVGYVAATTEKYSMVVSILNTKFRTSGKISGQQQMGSIFWSGQNRYQVQMEELSKYAELNLGDKVISTGYSQIFPEGVAIGSIAEFSLNEGRTAYSVTIDLEIDISAISEVVIVANNNFDEVDSIFKSIE